MSDTLPTESSGAEAPPRITVVTPADQLAHAQSLLPPDEATATPEEGIPDVTPPDSSEGSESSAEEETEQEGEPKQPSGIRRRMQELVEDKREAQRRADAMAAQLERAMAMLERQGGQPPQAAPVDPNAAPDPSAYSEGELDRNYLRDMARHEARQELAMFQAEQERQRQVAEIRTREDQARARWPDYNEVVTGERLAPLLQGNPGLVEILATHESGPDLAYYLGSHPEELQALARMKPAHAAVRLGQLIPALQPQDPPAPRPVSKAPAPISPLRGSGAAPAINFEQQLEALEAAGDYDKWRALKHATRK